MKSNLSFNLSKVNQAKVISKENSQFRQKRKLRFAF